jgi:unsaturated chondroitin disaccharide hydrolase
MQDGILFNEGKQDWKDGSTWSRGQAWVIYTASVAYQYSSATTIAIG